jgi:hypothetical protein
VRGLLFFPGSRATPVRLGLAAPAACFEEEKVRDADSAIATTRAAQILACQPTSADRAPLPQGLFPQSFNPTMLFCLANVVLPPYLKTESYAREKHREKWPG